ncbi:MAG: 23S rRNA pseudouridine2605 synthase [Alteromonas naphthalenivorans]|jgi:23S rRNA pseudouridine2605 synthase
MKLNVFVAQTGLCSRRKAMELIKMGDITVNHWDVRVPSYEIKPKDTIRFKKKIIKIVPDKPVYIAMNKPIGAVTTLKDPHNRPTIIDLLGKEFKTRVFPIGRLDTHTTGIILLTNDGELSNKLAHPKYKVKKVYQITLDQPLKNTDLIKIKRGLHLKDGPIKLDEVEQGYNKAKVKVTLHSGRTRIVRRIFESLGYTPKKLERINFAGITKKGLAQGEWRDLRRVEVVKMMRENAKTIDPIKEATPPKRSFKAKIKKTSVLKKQK